MVNTDFVGARFTAGFRRRTMMSKSMGLYVPCSRKGDVTLKRGSVRREPCYMSRRVAKSSDDCFARGGKSVLLL